ncbi:MAG: CDP-glycerol glycerophosphotransferase family protein [Simkaniaceae bacterium]|nr:CDP-glycerol glycerophosphotransferase family protein [Candidatus Sacchlamyda saccharinae]
MFVAISTGPSTHLDHLAPLCYLLEIPLIVTEKEHLTLGKKFYPMVNIQYISLSDLSLDHIAKHYDTILTCGKFWALELKPLMQMLYNKEIRFVFSPHGYSDKEELLNKPVAQDIDLRYEEMGNVRHWFYQKHKEHLDALAEGFFKTDKKTVLYAPTWETTATPTSFFESTSRIIEELKDSYHLLIKLHPLLEENDPASFHQILGKYETKATFILEFPPVYPLLEKTDIYLGDFSSVGYDFLVYDRPMFFLKSGGRLQKCGELYTGDIRGDQKKLSEVRRSTYQNAFAKVVALRLQSHGVNYSSASSASSSSTTARGSSTAES